MISLFWVPSQRYPMGNYKVECVLHQTNKQNSARARRTKNTYSSKVHPIYGCTLCSFTEPFSGASGGRARRARRALVRVTPGHNVIVVSPHQLKHTIAILRGPPSISVASNYSNQSPSRASRAARPPEAAYLAALQPSAQRA